MNCFTTLKQQCIPKKTVRYNKKVDKDNHWITNGILKSINSKDKLYKALIKTPKESPNYAVLQTNFKTYRKIIRRSIMFAKRDYYRSVFNKYSANLKMTWQTINENLNGRKKKREYPQELSYQTVKQFTIQSKLQRHLTIILLVLARQTILLRRKIKNTQATYATN